MIKLRTDGVNSASYADLFPPCSPGSLLEGTAPEALQAVWRDGQVLLASPPRAAAAAATVKQAAASMKH